jgi:hypothetical protein
MIRRWWIGVVLLASVRLAHINLLWADEDYHLAAAIQILQGRVPYRDFWYDKPPLAALFYSVIGGYAGWPLRVLDVVYVVACCWVAYLFARDWWGEREGRTAALLLAFFMAFYLTSATVPLAVDGLLVLPQLGAVYLAGKASIWREEAGWQPAAGCHPAPRRVFAVLCGLCCAVGILTNVKGVFVAATCAVWVMGELPLFLTGVLVPMLVAAGAGWGLLRDFYVQVWQWGLVYAGTRSSVGLGVRRCADWLGFHGALLAGVIVARKEVGFRVGVWLVLSCVPLVMGNHFAPRYFFQVLPVMVILGGRGVVLACERSWGRVVMAVLLLVPVVRFGPRYGELVWDNVAGRRTVWADAALDLDAQQVADFINARKRAGDRLFVWGYRPDVYVYTRLMPAGKFWDSQPLDGVPADRHLESQEPSAGIPAAAYRAEVVKSAPRFVVDGLGLLNPGLGLGRFPDLAGWLGGYRVVGRTKLSWIYERR